MELTRELPIDGDDLTLTSLTVKYNKDTRQLSVSLDRDYTGAIASAPSMELRAGGDVVSRSSSIAFTSGLSAKRDVLVSHGYPIVFTINGYGTVDISDEVRELLPTTAGPKIQVTTLFSRSPSGIRTVTLGESAELVVGVTNYGDATGKRRITLSLDGTQVGSCSFTVEPGEHSSKKSITVSIPEAYHKQTMTLEAGRALVPLQVE